MRSEQGGARLGVWDMDRIGAWTLGFGRHNGDAYCYTYAHYGETQRLYVTISLAGSHVMVHLYDSDWGPLVDGAFNRVELRFDAAEAVDSDAWLIGGTGAQGLRVELSPAAFEALARSGAMAIHDDRGGEIGVFQLDGLYAALQGVARCVASARGGS